MRVAILTQSYPFEVASENFLVLEEAVWDTFPDAEITWVPDVSSGPTYGTQRRNVFLDARHQSTMRVAFAGLRNFPWRHAWSDLSLSKRASPRVFWGTIREGMQIGYRLSRLAGLPQQDVYYAYWGRTDALVASILATKWAAMSVYRNHRFDLYEERTGHIPFKRVLAASKSEGSYLTEEARNYALSRFGHHMSSVYPLGINLDQIGKTLSRQAVNQESIPFLEQVLTVVSVSGLSKVKRVCLIPEFLSRLSEEIGKQVSWLHIGGSPVEVAELHLKAMVHLDESQVEILPFVPNSEILEILEAKSGAVFLNISSSEGVPVSIMEAMASGLAVIATDVGGTKSIVFEPDNLLLPAEANLNEWTDLASGWLSATNVSDTASKNSAYAAARFDYVQNYSAFISHIFGGFISKGSNDPDRPQ
jgi:glycosyltransferase involved in cell wall biosynthesis